MNAGNAVSCCLTLQLLYNIRSSLFRICVRKIGTALGRLSAYGRNPRYPFEFRLKVGLFSTGTFLEKKTVDSERTPHGAPLERVRFSTVVFRDGFSRYRRHTQLVEL